MQKHWLTSLFGVLALIGGALTTTAAARSNTTLNDVAQVLKTIGVAGIGLAAADARNVPNGTGGRQ